MSRIIMLDTEFLDPRPGGVILSIGAVVIDMEKLEIGDQFYVKINADDAVRRGCTIMPSTLRWWMEQSAAARDEAFSGEEDMQIALAKFANFVKKVRNWNQFNRESDRTEIYSCGKDDIVLIEAAERLLTPHATHPWKYNEPKDFRTIRDLFPQFHIHHIGTEHNALDDATWQARHFIEIMKYLRSVDTRDIARVKFEAPKPVAVEEEL